MSKWTQKINRFWTDEAGQSTTEYILILAVVVMIALKFKEQMQKRMEGYAEKIGEKIDSAIDL